MLSKRSTVPPLYSSNEYNENYEDLESDSKQFPTNKSKDVLIKSYNSVKLKPLKFGETEAVYRTSVGVLPMRNSEDFEDLKVVMKGKPILKPLSERKEYESRGGETKRENYHLNTPVTDKTLTPMPPKYDNELDTFKTPIVKHRPAILPQTGTTSTVKMIEKPKAKLKSELTIPVPIEEREKRKALKRKNNENSEIRISVMNPQDDILQETVQQLIEEAQSIANGPSSFKPRSKSNSITSTTKKLPTKIFYDSKQNSHHHIHPSANMTANERILLKNVESLISAIKSGELIKEQEKSDARIQEILNAVLDRREVVIEDTSENTIENNNNNNLLSTNFEEPEDALLQSRENTMTDGKMTATDKRESLFDNETEIDAKSEKTKLTNISKSLSMSGKTYESNIELFYDSVEYLSQLPEEVRYEDVMNIQARKLNLQARKVIPELKEPPQDEPKVQRETTKIYNERNLHSFCSTHEENLKNQLPRELLDATRKYHVRDKYQSKIEMRIDENEREDRNEVVATVESYIRTKDAAKRVYESLVDDLKFEHDRKTLSSDNFDTENDKIDENFVLESKKMKLLDESDDSVLVFLRPAPPKMSLRQSRVRQRLFPEYQSLEPIEFDIDYLKKENAQFEFEDDEYVDEQEIEIELLRKKLINRRWNSDLFLDKLADKEFKKLNRSSSIDMNTLKNVVFEFMKIDSNYNDAIQEAADQKDQILKIHNKKIEETKIENESRLEEIPRVASKQSKITTTTQTKSEYFPKNVNVSLAEMALKAGKNYIRLKSTKEKEEEEKAKKSMDSKIIGYVQKMLFENEYTPSALSRASSMKNLRVKRNLNEPQLCVPKTLKNTRKPSIPNLLDFAEFKNKFDFDSSKWNNLNNEREWVRDIWNEWFDEVIPLLDGTFKMDKFKDKKQGDNFTESSMATFQPEVVHEEEVEKKPHNFYEDYDEVNFECKTEMDAILVSEVEAEISALTKKIEKKLNVFDLCRRGALYRKLGMIKNSLADLNRALEMEPNYVDAFWQRHLAYLIQNKKDDAMFDLNMILKINRTHAGAYLSRGDICVEKHDIPLAIVNYSQAIKYNPNDYQAFYKRAKMYELKGDMRMAMDDYLTTTKLNPKIVDAWFKHGMSYFKNKNWQYAIVDFTELLKHNPNQAEARLYRGKCYLYLKEYQPAINDFSIALHLDPNNWQAYYHRGCLLRKIDKSQSLKDLSISLLIENSYENVSAYLHRAIIYSDEELYEEAIKDYEHVLLLDKEFAPAYVNLGVIYMNVMLNYWKAIKCFNAAIKSKPVYIRAYLCRARAFHLIHDYKRAYLDYTKAIHLDPINIQLYIHRGKLILEMGDLKLAAFCVQHAAFLNEGKIAASSASLQVTQNRDQSFTQQAVVYSFLKSFPKAIHVLNVELKSKPDTKTFNLLAKIQMDAKNWEDACVTLQKSIDFNKSDRNSSKNKISTHNLNQSQKHNENSPEKEADLVDSYFMKGRSMFELARFHDAHTSFNRVIEMKPTYAEAYFYRGLTRVYLQHPKCIRDFNIALAHNPKYFEAYLARAAVFGLQKRFAKAILNCNEALKINSKCVRGYLYRGALKYNSKSYVNAIKDFTEAIKLLQTCTLAYFNRAICYQHLKKYNEALRDYSIVLLMGDYLKFQVCINRGLLYYNLGNYGNALHDFINASNFVANDHKIAHIIGLCHHKLDNFKDSIRVLSDTIKLNPHYYDAIISRGNVYIDYGHEIGFRKAQSDYEHVLLLNPYNLNARINLAYLLQMRGKHLLAWRQFSIAITQKRSYAPAYEGRSIIFLQMSNMDSALKDMNTAIRLAPTAELFVNRGVIYQFMGDNVNAMRDYQSAILMNPKYPFAYYNSANVLLQHKQYDQALKNYDEAIEKCNLKDETTYQNRAIAKALLNRNADALKDFTIALSYSKYSTHILMNRALLFFRLKYYKDAEADFSKAIEISPYDSILFKFRGDCRAKLRMRDEAMSDYKISMELYEDEKLNQKFHSHK